MDTAQKIPKTIWIVTTIIMFVANGLSTYLPINGVSTSQISDTLQTMITPAGFTFGIRSIIYIGVIYLSYLYIAGRISLTRQGRRAYIISCISNACRILARHHSQLELSMLIIVIILLSLLYLYRSIVSTDDRYHWYASYAVSLYIGRVQIATLVMTTIYTQHGLGLIDVSTMRRPIAIITIATILNIYIQYHHQNIITSLVAIRALYGIYMGQTQETIKVTSLVAIAILCISIPVYIYRSR